MTGTKRIVLAVAMFAAFLLALPAVNDWARPMGTTGQVVVLLGLAAYVAAAAVLLVTGVYRKLGGK